MSMVIGRVMAVLVYGMMNPRNKIQNMKVILLMWRMKAFFLQGRKLRVIRDDLAQRISHRQ